ncbi:hypothetical protein K6Y31_16495 [Motilimonas cestriensis]|uniref:Lipoprotein n=1 Tax=Motilimonas cestriensis TaxID=2742685 RepID=A0ABS8WE43_9GAMM|nr:hypothetical protein [Motilimonas cestriensis]MCE2596397.1 hypothetical protein [Motilimonas cestriensis]
MKINIMACALAALIATGCSAPYEPKQGEETARIKPLTSHPYHTICKNEQENELIGKSEDGFYTIPAGERISLKFKYYETNGVASYSCWPSLSFVPKSGIDYYSSVKLRGGACYIELLKRDDSSEVGLSNEKTVKPMTCKKWNTGN